LPFFRFALTTNVVDLLAWLPATSRTVIVSRYLQGLSFLPGRVTRFGPGAPGPLNSLPTGLKRGHFFRFRLALVGRAHFFPTLRPGLFLSSLKVTVLA
jgi:hypothetical protein